MRKGMKKLGLKKETLSLLREGGRGAGGACGFWTGPGVCNVEVAVGKNGKPPAKNKGR